MARKSFTIRSSQPSGGSYLQYGTSSVTSYPTVAITGAVYTIYGTTHYTTSTAHGFSVGDTIAVTGTTPSSYSTTANIGGVNSSTSFYFINFNGNPKSALAQGSTTFTFGSGSGVSASAAATYTGVTGTVNAGATGSGAVFTITKTGSGTVYSGFTTITVTSGGSNYQVGNTITIPGASLGGGGNLVLVIATKADGLYASGGTATITKSNSGIYYTNSDTSGAANTYLKGDDVQIAPLLNTQITAGGALTNAAFFEAYAYDYSSVILKWGLTLYDATASPAPYSVHIVYSSKGCPDTIAEGSRLIDTRTIEEFTHTNIESDWAYYTMFIRYLSTSGDDYYEQVAKLEVIVPNDYGSTEDLYSKIPMYYQNQDETSNGDLKKYLSIFGWEVDKVRTTLDFSMAMKDPLVGNEETLNFLAQDMGISMTTNDLGSQRLRELLRVVSTTRRNNGSPRAVEKYLEAICGTNVDVSSTNKTIKIYSQRVNLLKDPKFVNGVAAGIDASYPFSTYSGIEYDNAAPNTTVFASSLDGGTATSVLSSAVPTTQNWVSFTPEGNTGTSILETGGITYAVSNAVYSSASSGTFTYTTSTPHNFTSGDLVDIVGVVPTGYNKSKQSVIVLSTTSFKTVSQGSTPGTFSSNGTAYKSYSYVKVVGGETFYFSINTPSYLSGVKNVQGAIKSVSFFPTGGAGAASATAIVTDTVPQVFGSTNYWRLEIPSTVTNYTNATLSIEYYNSFGGQNITYLDFSYTLLERDSVGEYFDGDVVEGGWLLSGLSTGSISDYRWLGAKNNSYSVYSANWKKTQQVISRFLQTILPVPELLTSGTLYSNGYYKDTSNVVSKTPVYKYAVTYDVIPGDT